MTTPLSPTAIAATAPVPLWRPALTLFVVLSLVTGLAYPLVVTGVAQTVFPREANGSLVQQGGQPVGSALIGQAFADTRALLEPPVRHRAHALQRGNSGGSNLAPTAPALTDAVKARLEPCARPTPATPRPCRWTWSPLPPAGWTAHQPRRRRLPGGPRRPGARPAGRAGEGAGGPADRGPLAGLHRRAARQRAGTEPGAAGLAQVSRARGPCEDGPVFKKKLPPC